jgi:hypothetical protein
MSNVSKASAAVVLLLAVAASGLSAAPSDTGTVPLELTSPDLRFEAGSGGLTPVLDGFGRMTEPGRPALPVRILMVAIPEGVEPTLAILRVETHPMTRLDIAPAPRWHAGTIAEEVGGAGTPAPERDDRREPAAYARNAFWPDAPLRLGTIGYLRDQRFVEVHYTPLLYNPARGTGVFYSRIEAEVRFAPASGAAVAGPAAPSRGMAASVVADSPDPFFEDTYASSLVNYEQGKSFRVRRAAPAGTAALGTEVAGATVAAGPSPSYKLMVSGAGVDRMDYAYISANAPGLLGTDPRTFNLVVDGAEVPIAIRNAAGASGEVDGSFDPGDVIEFYGRPKTEAVTVVNDDTGDPLSSIYQSNDFSDTQVYWLSASGAAGSHLRIPSFDGSPVAGYTQAADFADQATWDENNLFLPLGGVSPFFSVPSLLAGGSAAQRDLSLALPGLAPVATSMPVIVRLRGGTDVVQSPDHHTRAWINSNQTNVADFTWDGQTIGEQSFNVPQSTFTNPATIHVQALLLSGVTVDRQYLDTITVNYRRLFTALGDVLTFAVPNQNARYQVTGLGATAPIILEVGRTLAANGETNTIRVTGAVPSGAPTSIWTFEVPQDTSPGAPPMRTFVVAGPAAWRVPDAIVAAAPVVLRVPDRSVDLIVIASRDVVDASPGGSLDLLLQHRAAQGLSSAVVYMDQIYDEFSNGRRDANATRSFLQYAYANWRGPAGTDPAPSFVLLVGDATPDYKNTLQRSDWIDEVPTPIMYQVNNFIGYYSSDNLLAAVNGVDQIPDLFLGRISTRSAAASAAVFDKIRAFENAPPSGLWKGRALLAAGDPKPTSPGEELDFQAVNEAIRTSYFSAAPYSSPSPPLYFAQPPWSSSDAAGFNQALKNELASGDAVMTFVGHGSFDTIGLNTVFTTADATGLTNGLLLPFMVNVNCLTGGFHDLLASGSLAEGMVNNPSGGAIAALAPSGLSNAIIGSVITDGLFGALYGPSRQRVLGPATLPSRVALWSQGSIVDLQSYTFLGDPASRIATPAPDPPTGLAAAAGNGRVDLSWSAPAVPAAGTRIYRAATSPSGNYVPVACASTGSTSCSDTSVTNATRYYYYAVSVDPEGFWGAASNFNSGCDSGPDCVTALPTNPNPPSAPVGLLVQDPGSGGRLVVSWTPNAETDLKQYTVRYGVQSGIYGSSVTSPPATTTVTLQGLQDGIRYYITVTATNTSGHESLRAAEQSGVSHLFQGVAPPRAISDLTLSRSGNDLVLTWSRPLVDIYGRPTTVIGYRIYRGSTPSFQVTGMSPLATIGSGATTTWTHSGGVLLAGNSYYLVTAQDASGLSSGAGRDLPNGIANLGLSFTAPSTVHLTWNPVTTDVQGLPTLLDHYQVHVTSTPVSRSALGPSTLFLDNVTGSAVDLSLPTNPKFITVLAVDDRGNLSPY